MANRQADNSGKDPGANSEVGQELTDLLTDWREDCGHDTPKGK
jgi:hypothetical protein